MSSLYDARLPFYQFPDEVVRAFCKSRLTALRPLAAAIPSKTTGAYIAKRVMAFLTEIGCAFGDLVVKSDQEPAIISIVEEVGRLRAAMCTGNSF